MRTSRNRGRQECRNKSKGIANVARQLVLGRRRNQNRLSRERMLFRIRVLNIRDRGDPQRILYDHRPLSILDPT